MKVLFALAALAFAVSAGAVCAQPSPRAAISPVCAPVPQVQFVVMQYLYVETVTCKDWSALFDLNQYGTVEGVSCTITGDLPLPGSFNAGHVGASFDFGGLGRVDMTGCRVDSTSAMPGYAQFAVECT